MPDISDIGGIRSPISPLAASHRLINFISSDCELPMRAANDRRSFVVVCDSINAVISTACA
jgi:hypothetical protein